MIFHTNNKKSRRNLIEMKLKLGFDFRHWIYEMKWNWKTESSWSASCVDLEILVWRRSTTADWKVWIVGMYGENMCMAMLRDYTIE